MIKVINNINQGSEDLLNIISGRTGETSKEVLAVVEEIINDVKINGDDAVKKYTQKFDNVTLDDFMVTQSEIDEAYKNVNRQLLETMKLAYENITAFHKKQMQSSWSMNGLSGATMGQRVVPLQSVAFYVPGGTAVYPSSVLMNAIPAKVAGVKDVCIITPPDKNGDVNINILAAAKIAGVDKIYKIGGAQGVAAVAYGTKTIKKVDKIVGPGNIYVATAKRLLFGIVDIDMVAGPSEVLIIADESANPTYIAADLMSQAEHDVLASCILLCMSEKFADRVNLEIAKQVEKLKRKNIIKKSLADYGRIVVCKDIDECITLANQIAPEHLEIVTIDANKYVGRINSAGTIFVGEYSPEPLGDYLAGPNHVLPTGGTARFFSGLCVDSFIKKINFLNYTKPALKDVAKNVVTFANAEGLDAHANSVIVRFLENE